MWTTRKFSCPIVGGARFYYVGTVGGVTNTESSFVGGENWASPVTSGALVATTLMALYVVVKWVSFDDVIIIGVGSRICRWKRLMLWQRKDMWFEFVIRRWWIFHEILRKSEYNFQKKMSLFRIGTKNRKLN